MMNPRNMPPGVEFTNDSDISLLESVSQSRSGNRITNIVQYADPMWILTLVTGPMEPDRYRALQAWFHSLRGGLRGVLFRHPTYKKPALSTFAAAADSGVVASIVDGNVLTINNVSAALVLTTGDFISLLATNGIRAVVQVSPDAVTGNGTSRTVTVEPPLNAEFVGATAYFDRVELLTRPVATSWQKQSAGHMRSVTFQLAESRI